jgi:hypothetical protein
MSSKHKEGKNQPNPRQKLKRELYSLLSKPKDSYTSMRIKEVCKLLDTLPPKDKQENHNI